MMDKKTLIAGMIAGAVGFAAAAQAAMPAPHTNDERCYGVVRAGMNDCANAADTHGCHAKSEKDGDPGEYVMVPKGLCAKLVNGSVTPVIETKAEDTKAAE
jgi:uncharacterized membrane protein